jgi:hypothetical protein
MGLTVSGLAFAGATVFTLGAAESASAQTATVVPQRSSAMSYSLVTHHRHGRKHGGQRWHRRSGGGASYFYSYTYKYKKKTKTSWSWGCGCCC